MDACWNELMSEDQWQTINKRRYGPKPQYTQHYNMINGQINSYGNRTSNGHCNENKNQHCNERSWSNRGNRSSNCNRQNNFEKVPSRKIFIPSQFVGKVIGRGGATISDLQFESGAKITILKEELDGKTAVLIIGNNEQLYKAEELIKYKAKDNEYKQRSNYVEQHIPEPEPYAEMDPEALQKKWREQDLEYERFQKEKWERIGAIIKKFYKEKPEIANMHPEEIAAIRLEKNNIVVNHTFEEEKPTPIPNPVKSFEDAFYEYPDILEEIKKAGFTEPSPIQCQAWPIIMSGKDMIGIAQTGTGKTLAFLLPALIHINGQTRPREERPGPAALIFAPTRELALQIEREVNKYYYKGIKAVCVYGGGDRNDQIQQLKNGCDIVIATPGRFNDLYMSGNLPLDYITYVVLDEADRMLDMGFEPQIRKVMFAIRPDRQTIMTSATWPNIVRDLAKSYMKNPIQVYVGSLDLAATHTVTQTILMLEDEDAKFETFFDFAKNIKPHEKVICFSSKKVKADFISSELAVNGIDAATLHGNMDQCDREQALLDIADGTVQILVATDLASRGIDIDDITHVVNYDFPSNIEEYVHRVGRTGRAGKAGDSISYFTKSNWAAARELINILNEAQQFVPDELLKMAERFDKRGRNNRGGFRR